MGAQAIMSNAFQIAQKLLQRLARLACTKALPILGFSLLDMHLILSIDLNPLTCEGVGEQRHANYHRPRKPGVLAMQYCSQIWPPYTLSEFTFDRVLTPT